MPFPKLKGLIKAVAIVDVRGRVTGGLVEFVREASKCPALTCQRRFQKELATIAIAMAGPNGSVWEKPTCSASEGWIDACLSHMDAAEALFAWGGAGEALLTCGDVARIHSVCEILARRFLPHGA